MMIADPTIPLYWRDQLEDLSVDFFRHVMRAAVYHDRGITAPTTEARWQHACAVRLHLARAAGIVDDLADAAEVVVGDEALVAEFARVATEAAEQCATLTDGFAAYLTAADNERAMATSTPAGEA